MRKYLILALFLLWPFVNHAQNCLVDVQISTNAPGAIIFVNGEKVSEGSYKSTWALGDYNILILENEFEWNSQKFRDSIVVSDCSQSISINHQFKTEIRILTDPQNVAVYDGNERLGYTPLILENNNDESLLLRKRNYVEKSVKLGTTKFNERIKLDLKSEINHLKFVDSNQFLYLVASAAILGVSAAYFKVNADNKYDEYLSTKNSSFLDETERLDLISGISFAALQLNIGYIVYKLIAD
ncbi:MAG: hypothetical protein K9J12_06690 [Melioribacteraceae bacterium]|nr:hypothetical protein [Melioribacteraceae bacterium]MCF8264582.1 hypothetical protein [Melioribacteraceae bacterium]MCF8412323.1 hypothetical protein [Melioribacteraceae bacterium]